MQKIKVYCGESVQDKCHQQLHPTNEVSMANVIVLVAGPNEVCYIDTPTSE